MLKISEANPKLLERPCGRGGLRCLAPWLKIMRNVPAFGLSDISMYDLLKEQQGNILILWLMNLWGLKLLF